MALRPALFSLSRTAGSGDAPRRTETTEIKDFAERSAPVPER
jgi:hypothetical protein